MAATKVQSREAGERIFPLPVDASAWWAFFSSCLGGLVQLQLHAPARLREGLLLAFSFSCLFLASDWISSLSGKGIRGEIPKGQALSVPGIALLFIGIGSMACFYGLQAPLEGRFWLASLICGASLTVLMFLLRLELPPSDLRLLALSTLLCTAPALFLSFLAFGPRSLEPWSFWSAPALFFSVSSVFAWIWLQGLYHARRHLALLAAPLMALIIAALTCGADLAALALTAYLIYVIRRLLARYQQGADRLPEFSDIRKLGREQSLWYALMAASWALNSVLQ